MKYFFSIFLGFSIFLTACQEGGNKPVKVQTVQVNEKQLAVRLKALIDITYDHPEACIHNPDSLLSLVKTLPVSEEGKTLYELLLVNIGFCLKDEGYVLKSITYFEKAFTYYQEKSPRKIDFYNYIAKPLGNLYTRTGDFEKAALLQQSAINIAQQEKRTDILPSLYNNIAITFLQTKQHGRVVEACRNGLSLIKKANTTSAQLYNTLAQSFETAGTTDSALFYNKFALEVFDQKHFAGDTIVWQLSTLELQSMLAQDRLDFKTGYSSISKAIQIAEKAFPGTKSREKAKLYEVRGNLFVRQHQWSDAKSDFEKVFSLFGLKSRNYSFPDNTVTDATVGLARCYVHLLPDSAAFYYVKAIENDYLVQQFIVNKQSNYFNSSGNRKVLNEAINFMKLVYDEITGSKKEELAVQMLWITELSKGRQLLMEIDRTKQWQQGGDNTFQQAMAQLRFLHEEIAAGQDSVKIRQLKQQVQEILLKFQLLENYSEKHFSIPDKASFLEYLNKEAASRDFVSWFINEGSSSYVFLKTEKKLLVTELSDSNIYPLVSTFVDRYFRTGPSNYNNDPELYKVNSEAILHKLIPGMDLLQKRNLELSPDGFLYNVPVDALCSDGRFLVEKKNISYTYTLLLNQGNDLQPVYHSAITVFMKNRHGHGLADLPFAEEESEIIKDNFKSHIYANVEANDQAFISAMNTPAVIHVATHAIADEITGPYLALDKKLTLDKIQYTTTQSPLVVLSACYTASGKLIAAEGVEGLNKAFLSKGVKGVIASQWPVDDATMPQMIGLFYNQLAKTHHPALALADAKRIYLNNSPVTLRNPWYWASLSFTGSDVEIIVERKNKWLSYTAALLLSGAVTAFFLILRQRRQNNR